MDLSKRCGVMNITLSPEQMQLIEVQLAQGLFSSPSEVDYQSPPDFGANPEALFGLGGTSA